MEPCGSTIASGFWNTDRPAFLENFPLAAGGILRNLLFTQLVSRFDTGFNSHDQHDFATIL
jgi:hypothetical protein